MPTLTLSSKNQITIPVEVVKALRLKAGDKLALEQVDSRIVIIPERANWVDYFKGSMKGVYGTTKEEMDDYVVEQRQSPERKEWHEQFEDMMATDAKVRAIVEALRSLPYHTAHTNQLLTTGPVQAQRLDWSDVQGALEKLAAHGAVRKVQLSEAIKEAYRLVGEFAEVRRIA